MPTLDCFTLQDKIVIVTWGKIPPHCVVQACLCTTTHIPIEQRKYVFCTKKYTGLEYFLKSPLSRFHEKNQEITHP